MAPPTPSLHEHAEANLRFIRATMERSGTFSAVPGLGGAVMGGFGLIAAVVAAQQPTAERWLAAWLAAAAAAFLVGLTTMWRKAERAGMRLTGAVGRRFALSLAAPLVAGAAITFGLWLSGVWALMPAVWLLLYGTGVVTGGAFSVAPLRVMGVAFMLLGVAALLTPPAWGNVWLAIGFGGLQLGFGIYIARRHGG